MRGTGNTKAARTTTLPRASSIGWVSVAALSAALFVAGLPYRYRELGVTSERVMGDVAALPVGVWRSGLEAWVSTGLYRHFTFGIEVVLVLSMSFAATVIFRYRGEDRMALLASVAMLTYVGVPTEFGLAVANEWPAWTIPEAAQEVIGLTSVIALLFVFPDGRFVPRWTRYLAVVWISWAVATYFVLNFSNILSSATVTVVLFVSVLFNASPIAVQVYRYRNVSTPEERRRTRWVVLALGSSLAVYCVIVLSGIGLSLFGYRDVARLIQTTIGTPVLQLSLMTIPILALYSVLRHRLFGIEVVVNRAIVYGALTVCIVGFYVLTVGGLGSLFSAGGNLLVSLLATGVVAVVFAPLRDRIQRGANRLMYGERDDPYAVISRLGRRLEETLAPEAVLPAIVETVASALRSPHVGISLKVGEHFESAASFGEPDGVPLVLPLVYNNRTVGNLEVSQRSVSDPFTSSDRRLLADLARQAGIAAYAVSLNADLRRSRERLVTAREEERRRLRRDLHDGVGPRLAALTLKIETARNRMSHDPEVADVLSDLAERAREAVADVRRSVHALRPQVLDEFGLVPALREAAAQYGAGQAGGGLRITLDVPDETPPLSAAMEVAIYRISLEAMTNVVRHADASRCDVRLHVSDEAGELWLEVEDDGEGIAEVRAEGFGLDSMRERAEELGGTLTVERGESGGTVVRAVWPLPTEGAV